jgi:LmbE family N-acetylglucosaminyl deacetylase
MRGLRMKDLGTVLGVWAHPDDETYLSAGLMASAVASGSRVYCVTATRGEGGSFDEDRWPSATMGAVREQELLRSFAVLGVTEHEFLGFSDIDMDTPLPESGADRVRELVAEIRPQTVLTFGPDGMTGHVAHMSVSSWATEAFHASAEPGAKLYYAVYTQDWADEFVPELNKYDVFRPGTPPVVPAEDLAIAFELSEELLNLKMRAIREHVSQVEPMSDLFGDGFLRGMMHEESFRLAEEKA